MHNGDWRCTGHRRCCSWGLAYSRCRTRTYRWQLIVYLMGLKPLGDLAINSDHCARYQAHVLDLIHGFLLAALAPPTNLARVPRHIMQHGFALVRRPKRAPPTPIQLSNSLSFRGTLPTRPFPSLPHYASAMDDNLSETESRRMLLGCFCLGCDVLSRTSSISVYVISTEICPE